MPRFVAELAKGFILTNRHIGMAMRLLEPLQVLHLIIEFLVLASRLWCLLLLLTLSLPTVLLMLLLSLQSLMSRLILLLLLLPSLLLLLLFSLFNELRLLKPMLASCNQVFHSLAGTLTVCINELWLLPGMFASFNQISHSLTGTSILLLSRFFKSSNNPEPSNSMMMLLASIHLSGLPK